MRPETRSCVLLLLVTAAAGSAPRPRSRSGITFYATLQSPAEHPLYLRRAVQPPEYSTFGASGVGFMALRGFGTDPNG